MTSRELLGLWFRFRGTLPVRSAAETMMVSTAADVQLYKLPTEKAGCTVDACTQGVRVIDAGAGAGAAVGLQGGDVITKAQVHVASSRCIISTRPRRDHGFARILVVPPAG